MVTYEKLRAELVEIGRRLGERGLIAGSDGNISVKCADGRILVTPSGLNKGRMRPEDLVVVDESGRPIEGGRTASSELLMHLFAYARRPEIRAVVHAHPPYSTAFAVAGKGLPGDILPEVVVFVGEIPLAAYAPPGTESVPAALEPFVAGHNAILMRNHGLLTLGRTLEEAYNRHETVEHYARILWLATRLGEPVSIPPEDLKRLKDLRRSLDAR